MGTHFQQDPPGRARPNRTQKMTHRDEQVVRSNDGFHMGYWGAKLTSSRARQPYKASETRTKHLKAVPRPTWTNKMSRAND